jgi:hypothetical protein
VRQFATAPDGTGLIIGTAYIFENCEATGIACYLEEDAIKVEGSFESFAAARAEATKRFKTRVRAQYPDADFLEDYHILKWRTE